MLPGAYRAVIRESRLEDAGPGRYDAIERSIAVDLAGGVTPLDVTLTPDVPLALVACALVAEAKGDVGSLWFDGIVLERAE